MWYQDPKWWALFASVIALCVSILSALHTRQSTRSTIYRSLIGRALEINQTILSYKITGPIAYRLGIHPAEVEEFSAKAVLLLQQINLLREVYTNRRILGRRTVESHSNWVRDTLRPWIEADPHLKLAWEHTRDNRDLFEPKFLKWLKQHIEYSPSPN